jgi:hypothetical protein
VNVQLAAPVTMQLVHLLLADLVWIAMVLLSAAALGVEERHAIEPEGGRTVERGIGTVEVG